MYFHTRSFRFRNPTKKHVAAFGFLFVGYIISTQLGISLYASPAILTPAAGVALAGLWLGGVTLWPAIFLGSMVVQLMNELPLINLVVFPAAHTLQALFGVFILRKLGLDNLLGRAKDMFILIVASVVASTTVPTFGYAARYIDYFLFGGPLPTLSWDAWWTGIILSHLILTPFLIRWISKPAFQRTFLQYIEILASIGVLCVIGFAFFHLEITALFGISLVYLLLVPLMWISLRIGPRFMTLAFLLLAIIAISGIFLNTEAPNLDRLGVRLFQVEIFLTILASLFFILTAVAEERKEITKKLSSHVEKLQEAFEQIRIRDQAKSEFLAVLAHELRNPLSPVVSSLELLRINPANDSERLQILDVMDGNVRTMRRLLDDLFDVTRISQRKLKLKKELVDVAAVAKQALHSVEHAIREKKQALETSYPDTSAIVEADPIRLEQIISNLLSNASKFTDAYGTVSLAIQINERMVEIRVHDNGIGLAPEMLEYIFEPFHQVRHEKHINEGLGIGLSLTKKLTDDHGGTIEVVSKGVGHGSEFIVRLPLSELQPQQQTLPNATLVQNPEDGNLRILIVDDNQEAARGIHKLLSHAGFETSCVYSGEAALQSMKDGRFDLVVLDIGLPDISGYDVAKRMREELHFTGTIIALTGYGQTDDKAKAKEAGFDHHLVKPIRISELIALLNSDANTLS